MGWFFASKKATTDRSAKKKDRPAKRRSADRRPRAMPRVGNFERLESREVLSVTFHGGALLSQVEAQGVYLGSDWAANSALTSQAASLDQYLNFLVKSPYMDTLTAAGYNVGEGTDTAGKTLSLSLNKSSGITDAQIQSDLQAAISSSQLAAPDANRLYVVFVEPGVLVKLGADTSANSFLGYHGAFAGRDASGKAVDVHYAVMAYPGTPNPTAGSQGFATSFDQLTSVSSHEIAEAVTDPDVNYKALGWYDDQRNGEIGDLTNKTTTLGGYVVQEVVGKNDQPLSIVSGTGGTGGSGTGGSSNGGGSTGSTSLSAPQVAATPLSATSAQLTWKTVTGSSGYRVFLVNGSQSTLLGTLGASATSATITRLAAGSTDSFRVEAFSGATVADSAVVSVTLPTPQQLSAPQVKAVATSNSTVNLSWNAVTGAQGYRVYLWNGWRAVWLGTVDASTTSVDVVGLRPGSRPQFLVEAFNATSWADSAWVSITLPTTSTASARAAARWF
jgi:hypothetical protein